MILKRLAAVAFGIAFLMAIRLFTHYGASLISAYHARWIFMAAGAIALVLNFFSFQSSKQNPAYSLFFWGGSLLVFAGLIFKFMHWPYSTYILIAGLGITGVSFFLSSTLIDGKPEDDDLLDKPTN